MQFMLMQPEMQKAILGSIRGGLKELSGSFVSGRKLPKQHQVLPKFKDILKDQMQL